MRIAVISDIHSNLEALQKTIDLINKKTIDKIVCLGDIVGYGSNPKECLKIVVELTPYIVMGNHDKAAADLKYTKSFNHYALDAALWTHSVLSENEKEKLLSFPIDLEIEGLSFVHASPYKPFEWNYISTREEAFENFKHMKSDICFFGHSHIAEIYTDNYSSIDNSDHTKPIKLSVGAKYMINPGSVGQPRDFDWRLSFGVLDTEKLEYEFIRSEYDVKKAANKILNAMLPKYLADRILVGR